MQRWIEINSGGQAVDGFTIKELFRVAAERQLISDVEAWFGYHRARNKISHNYSGLFCPSSISFPRKRESTLEV